MKTHNTKKRIKWLIPLCLVVIFTCVVAPICAFYYVKSVSKPLVQQVSMLRHRNIAVVPGAAVYANGELSMVLRYRLDRAIELYKQHHVSVILMSGDNRFTHYNEPEAMRRYAIKHGVAANDIVCDYAGRRTYDTVYRAKHIFGVANGVFITQDRFMGRSMYLSKSLGLDVVGVVAETPYKMAGMKREYLACVSAVLDVTILHPRPLMGKPEPIHDISIK